MDKFFKELRRRNVVRVAGVYAVVGWVLIQIATTLEESMGLPSWFDGLIVAFLLIGLPIALIFAWAFELTPDGVVRTGDIPEEQSIAAETGRKLDYAIIVGIVVLGALILTNKSDDTETPPVAAIVNSETSAENAASVPSTVTALTPLDKSIAVLPFANRSPNPDDAFFANGVHDDLLTHLSKIADMHVISRTSVMGFAGSNRKLPDIGRELGVATVMEGAVQRAGNRVRINVQLIDVETDTHIWAEIYDRELTADNIFDIQSEITKAIAAALNTVLSDSDEAELANRPTQNLAAYDAFLTGKLRASLYVTGAPPLLKSIDDFNKAIALDPDFGEAYAHRAYSEISLHWYTAEAGDWLAAAEESLRMAQELAPDAVETHMASGYVHYWGHLDYAPADAAFERALEKSPNYPLAIAGKAFAARRAGRFDEAITLLEFGTKLDPLNSDMHGSLMESYSELGRFDEALEALRRAQAPPKRIGLDPTSIAQIWIDRGNIERAWQSLEQPIAAADVVFWATRAGYAAQMRDPNLIQMTLNDWPANLRQSGHAPEVYNIARAEGLLALGETDAARSLFQEIKARVDSKDVPYPEGWKANALYYPVELPGYVSDLDGLRKVVADYETSKRPDAWADVDNMHFIADAFAYAGDPDAAFDYVDRMIEIRGPYVYPRLSIDLAFDNLREHPRYLALKASYKAWAAN